MLHICIIKGMGFLFCGRPGEGINSLFLVVYIRLDLQAIRLLKKMDGLRVYMYTVEIPLN